MKLLISHTTLYISNNMYVKFETFQKKDRYLVSTFANVLQFSTHIICEELGREAKVMKID